MVEIAGKRRVKKVVSIGVRPVKGGKEVTTYSRSARGTRYRLDSVVYLTEGLDRQARRDAKAAAFETLLFEPVSL